LKARCSRFGTLEARKEAERINADLQKAIGSLGSSRQAALNLMDDAVRARNQAEQASAELQMLNRDMHWAVEPGTFDIMVGSSSAQTTSVQLVVK